LVIDKRDKLDHLWNRNLVKKVADAENRDNDIPDIENIKKEVSNKMNS